MDKFRVKLQDGRVEWLSRDQIIENAKKQEADGIEPRYIWADDFEKHPEGLTRRGWLVWSTWESGCGVCFKLDNGSYSILTGWQGDFCYKLAD